MLNLIGIMGVGGWGKNHVKALSRLRAEGIIDDFAVIDIDRERLRYVSKLYGCEGYTSLSEALKNSELEGLIISTPTPLHYVHAKEALENGLHVLVEKPITVTSKEAWELIELANKYNRVLMTGFLLRYSPVVQYVKEKLKQDPNYFGDILMISTRRVNSWQIREHDVGVIRDLVIHDIDLVTYMFDAKPIRGYAHIKNEGYKFEVFATGFIEYEARWNKLILFFEASWVAPQKFRRWVISGTMKEAKLDLVNHTLQIYTREETIQPMIPVGPDPLYRQDKNFVEAINNKGKPLVTGIDGYNALRVCEALLKSAKSRVAIDIS